MTRQHYTTASYRTRPLNSPSPQPQARERGLRGEVLLAIASLLLFATAAFSAPLQFTQQGPVLTIENQWAKYTIDASRGAQMTSFVWTQDQTEWCYGGANSGLFIDHLWQQTHPGELQNAAYEFEVLEQTEQTVKIRAWRDIRQQTDPTITGVMLEKVLTFSADTPAVRSEITLKNPTADFKRPGFWRQHCFYPGGTQGDQYYFRPSTVGLNLAAFRQPGSRRLGDEWVKDPTAGWTACVSPASGDGAVFLMDYNYLRWLYDCVPCWTKEYMYDRVNLPPAGNWQTEEWFIPTAGYPGVSYADPKVIGYVAQQDNSLAITLGAALGEQKDLTAQVNLFTYPQMTPVTGQNFKYATLGFAPVTNTIPFNPALATGFLARVHVTGEGVDSQFEAFFAPGVSPYEINPTRVVYHTPKPPKQKQYFFPEQAPALPEKPSILFLKGLHAERYQVEAAAKLLGATLKKSYFEANVYGHRVDYVPSSIEEMFQYNLIVIGNIDYEAIGEDFAAYLKYYVEHGGGLLVLGGDWAFGHGEYAGTPFEELLPIKCGGSFDLKPAGPNAVLTMDGEPFDPAAKPTVAFVHVPTEVKPGAQIPMRAGAAPFLVVGYPGHQGTVGVMLGAPLGKPALGEAFWQWRDWPKLMETIMGEQMGVYEKPPTTPAVPTAIQNSLVKFSTNKGDIMIETFDQEAPITAGNFLLLVKQGYYDGIVLHRVVPGFVVQGGDPTGTGSGGPGWSIPLEVKPTLKHERGYLSMARAPDPNSAGSQFFICLDTGAVECLDMNYAVFGKVLFGMDVVDKLQVGDKLLKVTLEKAGPNGAAAEKTSLAVRIDK